MTRLLMTALLLSPRTLVTNRTKERHARIIYERMIAIIHAILRAGELRGEAQVDDEVGGSYVGDDVSGHM